MNRKTLLTHLAQILAVSAIAGAISGLILSAPVGLLMAMPSSGTRVDALPIVCGACLAIGGGAGVVGGLVGGAILGGIGWAIAHASCGVEDKEKAAQIGGLVGGGIGGVIGGVVSITLLPVIFLFLFFVVLGWPLWQ